MIFIQSKVVESQSIQSFNPFELKQGYTTILGYVVSSAFDDNLPKRKVDLINAV